MLNRAKQFAASKQGKCLDTVCGTVLSFECKSGHSWTASALKYFKQKWCPTCNSLERMEKKEERLRRRRIEEENGARIQEELFEEAKRKVQQEIAMLSGAVLAGEVEVDKLARGLTDRFFCVNSAQCTYDEAFAVYKVLHSTEQFLQLRYLGHHVPQQKRGSIFRAMAKVLHPDKNRHPLAGEAFSKLVKVFQVASE